MRFFITIACMCGVLLSPMFASAQATTTVRTPIMARAIERANQEINRRITALQKFGVRVEEMKKINEELKNTLNTNIQLHINALAALKSNVEGATTEAILKTQVETLGGAYRVFVLMIPQTAIAAAADRIVIIVDMMVGVGEKLRVRIQSATDAGLNTQSLQKNLTDLGMELDTAHNKAQRAVTGTAELLLDNGDKTIMASNTTAFKIARTNLQDARAALLKARELITTLIQGLRSLNTNATTSVQVQVQ